MPTYRRDHEPVYPDGTKTRDTLPWSWLDRKRLVRELARVGDLRMAEGLDPNRCADGACGICGVVVSTGWHETDLSWPDGSPAPACGTCYPVWVKHGSPTFPDEMGSVVSECITHVPTFMGDYLPSTLVAFVHADAESTGERWPHLNPESAEAWRWRIWTRHHRFAPEEHRAEARTRYDAERARIAEHTATREAEVTKDLDAQAGF